MWIGGRNEFNSPTKQLSFYMFYALDCVFPNIYPNFMYGFAAVKEGVLIEN